MAHPDVKDYAIPAWPVRHNGKPPAVKASPLLGEHSGDVLQSWLGLGEREIAGPGGRQDHYAAEVKRGADPLPPGA